MQRRIFKITLAMLLTLTVFLFFCNIILNRLFYNPYTNYEINSKVFNLSVQTLMPNYSYAYISAYEPGTPKSFTKFS